MSVALEFRKHGPGTAGRNKDRDAEICALKAEGLSLTTIGLKVGLSRERIRQILWVARRTSDRHARIVERFWHPIETAPKDRRFIRVRRGDMQENVRWCSALDDWTVGLADIEQKPFALLPWEPTHWIEAGS